MNNDGWILEPVKLYGLWWSIKYDRTTWHHFAQGLLFGVLDLLPWLRIDALHGIMWITGYETARGFGDENCIGVGKCNQGFNLLDWAAFLFGYISVIVIVTIVQLYKWMDWLL